MYLICIYKGMSSAGICDSKIIMLTAVTFKLPPSPPIDTI